MIRSAVSSGSAELLLWILIFCLTAAAIMAVLVPLSRPQPQSDAAAHARAVYLDQLRELERDLAQGSISAADAEAARGEIARRVLAEAPDPESAPAAGSPFARRATALVALCGIPAVAVGLYVALGSPHLPGQPLAARLATPPAADDVEALIARVEDHLAKSPEDARGWDVIAPIYLRLGRMADAETAFRNAIRLNGSNAARQTGFGEALVASAGGIVTAEAQQAFAAANEAEPRAPAPRFYLALAAEQEGKSAEAEAMFRQLLAEAPADAPWRAPVEAALARLDPVRARGPSADDVAAAEAMTPDERTAMIEAMVASLAERLEAEPNDVDGWLRLIRSYVVLGRAQDAADAARAALSGVRADADRARVEALIANLGVTPAVAAVP
jgi:cytochrome c-type biogenesis protein CcmH